MYLLQPWPPALQQTFRKFWMSLRVSIHEHPMLWLNRCLIKRVCFYKIIIVTLTYQTLTQDLWHVMRTWYQITSSSRLR